MLVLMNQQMIQQGGCKTLGGWFLIGLHQRGMYFLCRKQLMNGRHYKNQFQQDFIQHIIVSHWGNLQRRFNIIQNIIFMVKRYPLQLGLILGVMIYFTPTFQSYIMNIQEREKLNNGMMIRNGLNVMTGHII